MCSLSVFM